MTRKAQARKASGDPAERELQTAVAREVGDVEDERGIVPGEARTRNQLEALEDGTAQRLGAQAAVMGVAGTDGVKPEDDEAAAERYAGETVSMVRPGLEEPVDVAARDVEAHKRQGFIVRDETEAVVEGGEASE